MSNPSTPPEPSAVERLLKESRALFDSHRAECQCFGCRVTSVLTALSSSASSVPSGGSPDLREWANRLREIAAGFRLNAKNEAIDRDPGWVGAQSAWLIAAEALDEFVDDKLEALSSSVSPARAEVERLTQEKVELAALAQVYGDAVAEWRPIVMRAEEAEQTRDALKAELRILVGSMLAREALTRDIEGFTAQTVADEIAHWRKLVAALLDPQETK